MKFKMICSTDTEDITLKINAECEEDAEAIALTKYDVKEVKTIVPLTKEKSNKFIHDPIDRRDYPYIKNTGKSTIRIFT
jgi:hypothetical protein